MNTLSKYDNRTDPVFQGVFMTNSVNLGLTTRCTMSCPNCNTAIPKWKSIGMDRHAAVEDIVRDAALMRPMRLVRLTGGEPTLHPRFEEIARNAREWFDTRYLVIEMNGHGYRRYRHLFQELFDKVFITHYVKDAIYPGSPDNTAVIEEAQRDLGDRLVREVPVTHDRGHLSLGVVDQDDPCTKWYNPGLPAGWHHGRLYACCVTFGIDAGLGIPVTPDWREQIIKQPMGCSRCCFRGT